MKKPIQEYVLVDDNKSLANFCQRLADCEWFAIDTEFIREKTYFPQLCLVQTATPDGETACLDMLSIGRPDPLLSLLLDPGIRKVLHAGSQDMEIFTTLCGESPQNVFDTQIAAPLLGYPEQIGYGALVEERLGKSLSKSQSRTNWAVRPLNDKQLQYAADDVIYLSQMFPGIYRELDDLHRLAWLQEDFEILCSSETYLKNPADVWQRIRQIDRLKKSSLAIAQALAEWRENTARKQDMPRNWLLKDDALIDIARLRPRNSDELATLRGLSNSASQKYTAEIIEICLTARDQTPKPLPPHTRKHKMQPHDDALVDLLSAIAKITAGAHRINHAVLAPRKDLEKLVRGDNDSRLSSGWRRELVGDSLQQLLEGKLTLSVDGSGGIALQIID